MLRVGFRGIFRQQAKLRDMFTQLRQLVLAVHPHAGKPAEMVEAKIVHLQFMAIHAQNGAHIAHRGNRHIADVQHACVGAQATHALSDNRRRVGVVHDPRLFVRVAFHPIDQLYHRQDSTQAICQPAGSAGFLADHPVAQRDLFILLAHFVLSDAHLGKNKMRAAEGHFWVAGDGEFDALAVVANNLLHHGRNGVLARLVNVIQADLCQREIMQTYHQAFHNTWRVGATAAGNRQNKWGCKHL